ncbi:MAG: type II toxin-antitoxin system HipA family toxin [Bacteroidaceae bacterium]|nr:type II toxin-antitoxin system HipA family toxin [Bacteroidaceae bacterium]
MKKIERLTIAYREKKVGTLSLTPDNRLCAFEYDRGWLNEGFSISPLELPLRAGVYVAKPEPFRGAFGIFEDSLPDGYGRYLLHKALLREGVNDSNLSALDRLSLVGSGGMGALTYQPETSLTKGEDIRDFDMLQEKALEVLREQQDTDAGLLLYNSGNSGGARPKAIFSDAEGHWLVKFRHIYDPQDIGKQEYHYNEVARRCGITVPDFKLINGRYFTTRRFDLTPLGERLHTATAGGLLCVSLSTPVLDYGNLLALTGYLTQDVDAVEEMYRRMVFNYLTDNKDDHCKNFSFYVEDDNQGHFGWHLAPAYDLTLCSEGYNGEHATSVNGTGHPTLRDMIAVGTKINMKERRCLELYEEVKTGCGDLLLNRIEE